MLAIVADHFFFSALHKRVFFRYIKIMPELPEVETVMRGMIPALEDQSIRRVIINRFDLRGGIPDDFAARTEGAHVETLARRGKYILIHFDNDLSAVLHLGMSGRIRIFPRSNAYTAKKHDHVLIDTVAGARIAFEDPRRFGMLYLLPRPTWQQNAPFAARPSRKHIGRYDSIERLLRTTIGISVRKKHDFIAFFN